jgi:lactoylglutathione lyase
MIKFAYAILYVEDVIKTIRFYEQAFGFSQKFITSDNSNAELM